MSLYLREGQELPVVSAVVSQETVDKYALVSGDWNPLHVDPEFGKLTIFGSTIAHGPIALDYAIQAVCRYLGQPWLTDAAVRAKFVAPVRPGDKVTAVAQVMQVARQPGGNRATFAFECQNQAGATVIVGEIDALLPD